MLDQVPVFTSEADYSLHTVHAPDKAARHKALITTLVHSENLVRQLIAQMKGLPIPPLPTDGGHLEYGLLLYWLDNPPIFPPDMIEALVVWDTLAVIASFYGAETKISTADYEELLAKGRSEGVAGADGTLYGTGKYETFDAHWILVPVYFYANIELPHLVYPFDTNPQTITVPSSQASISIAIIGDWGTGVYGSDFGGQGPAVAVINAVKKLAPDYMVHLGDVYYVGSDDRIPEKEEQTNFVALLPSAASTATKCFTLNSNHEMYGAAQGYFKIALTDARFSAQSNTSYFALSYGQWLVLGLDSAYYDQSSLYMEGALGDSTHTQQADFIKGFGNLSQKKVLAMTHHNGLSYDGVSRMSIWDDMATTLGSYTGTPRAPDYWYWGHLHQGTVYNANSAAGNDCLCRCAGHAAFPFGDTAGIVKNNVDYNAQTPITPGNVKVQNGFTVLTLKPDGSLVECFYEVKEDGGFGLVWEA